MLDAWYVVKLVERVYPAVEGRPVLYRVTLMPSHCYPSSEKANGTPPEVIYLTREPPAEGEDLKLKTARR